MKTEDVISIALASGMYQDDEMFFSPSTGEADVHISDLEYFAKLVKERTLSKQKAGYYQEGYETGQHDMFTKLQNVDTSEKRVHGTDKSIHEPWDTSDMAYRPNGLSVEQEKLCKYCGGIGQVVCDGRCMPEQTPDDLLRQSEREGWRYAKECEAEIKRLTDLNKRLVAAAKELGYADDAHEWDDAWSKMCKLFKEC